MAILTKETKTPRQTQKIIILLETKIILNIRVSAKNGTQFLHLASFFLSTHVAYTSGGAGRGRASGLTKLLICPKPGQNS